MNPVSAVPYFNTDGVIPSVGRGSEQGFRSVLALLSNSAGSHYILVTRDPLITVLPGVSYVIVAGS
jgi:hypothetical protein